MTPFTIGLVGAGAIGRFHAGVIRDSGVCRLVGVTDPTPAGEALAKDFGVPAYGDHNALLARAKPQALLVATPNQTHVAIALDSIAAGVAPLIEKPVAETVADGERLAAAAQKAGVPTLVGHHRRHNPVIRAAREAVRGGTLGRLVSATVMATFYKHAEYFDVAWRRTRGGGPILINLIHEIDLIRFVCGEIVSVQALVSNATRGFEVEDTAAILLRLESGALVTISLSDTAVAPWSWDLASGELPAYPTQPAPVNSHFLAGDQASLALPSLDLWRYDGKRNWFAPMTKETLAVERGSPYVAQLRHLGALLAGRETPVIDAADATRTLRATLAVVEAAKTGRVVSLEA